MRHWLRRLRRLPFNDTLLVTVSVLALVVLVLAVAGWIPESTDEAQAQQAKPRESMRGGR